MLILTRRLEESIAIGDDIEIFVSYIGEDQVKLGIKAPKEVVVLRRELLNDFDCDSLLTSQASGSSPAD